MQRYREVLRARQDAADRWLPGFFAEMKAGVAEPLQKKHGIKLSVSARSVRRWHKQCPTVRGVANLVD